MIKLLSIDDHTRCAMFGSSAGVEEYYLTITSKEQSSLADSLDEITGKYCDFLTTTALSDSTAVFSRIYLSDIENQKETLAKSPLYSRLKSGSVSVIQQRPVLSGAVSLFSYHVKVPNGMIEKELISSALNPWRNGASIKGKNYSMLWTSNYCGSGAYDSAAQTEKVFQDSVKEIESRNMSLLGNTVRTWVYVRDVDNLYRDMVQCRRSLFARKGLTEKTRYIASTGIEARSLATDSIIHLDCMSMGGIAESQLVRMDALDHLSPTIEYGVTFERGTRVRFGDRSHLYISGTASINSRGEVLHLGDVRKQTERTIENVDALLNNQGAKLRDMAYILVYLRDTNDRNAVREIVQRRFPQNVPCIYAEAPVCRPTWLIEIEGVGVIDDSSEYAPFL